MFRCKLVLGCVLVFWGTGPAFAADCAWLQQQIPQLRAQCASGMYCKDLDAFKAQAKANCGSSFDPADSSANTRPPAVSTPIPPAPIPAAPSPCDPATNAEAVREAREGTDRIKKFVKSLQSSGLPVPSGLAVAMKTLNKFTTAADMGVDLAEAAGQADYEVRKIVANKYALCEGDEDEKFICYAKIDRQWQARNVNAALNWNNPGSVVRRAVAKWLGAKCNQLPR